VDDPVEPDVDPAVPVRRQRPLARPGQIADDLDLEVGGRSKTTIFEVVFSV